MVGKICIPGNEGLDCPDTVVENGPQFQLEFQLDFSQISARISARTLPQKLQNETFLIDFGTVCRTRPTISNTELGEGGQFSGDKLIACRLYVR